MTTFFAGIHFIAGVGLLLAGVVTLGDAWKTPALVLVAAGMIAIAAGVGVLRRARWAGWPVVPLLVIGCMSALVLLAGPVVWPESSSRIIILAAGAAFDGRGQGWTGPRRSALRRSTFRGRLCS